MSVDLGQVVGKGIRSITSNNNIVTVTYTDNSTSTFTISGVSIVDTVASGNSNAVSSNAVYNAIEDRESVSTQEVTYGNDGKFYFAKYGRMVIVDFNFTYTKSNGGEYTLLINIPTGFTPSNTIYDNRSFKPRNNTIFPGSPDYTPIMYYLEKQNNTWKFGCYNRISGTQTVRGQLFYFTD